MVLLFLVFRDIGGSGVSSLWDSFSMGIFFLYGKHFTPAARPRVLGFDSESYFWEHRISSLLFLQLTL